MSAWVAWQQWPLLLGRRMVAAATVVSPSGVVSSRSIANATRSARHVPRLLLPSPSPSLALSPLSARQVIARYPGTLFQAPPPLQAPSRYHLQLRALGTRAAKPPAAADASSPSPSGKVAASSSADATTPPALETENLQACIKRVVFHSPDTGYTVLSVRTPTKRKLLTVVCFMPTHSARIGEYVEIRGGSWKLSKQYGTQLCAKSIQVIRPTDSSETEKYLSTFIAGIGPAQAKRLVEAFGSRIFDVLDHSPDELLAVPGITQKKMRLVVASYREQQESRSVLEWAISHGIGNQYAVAMWKRYHTAAIDVASRDPYELTRTIPGFSFLEAEQLARKLGLALDANSSSSSSSSSRLKSALHHALQLELGSSGNCGVTAGELVTHAAKFARVDRAQLEAQLETELATGSMMLLPEMPATEPRSRVIFSQAMFRAEQSIGESVARLLLSYSHPIGCYQLLKHLDAAEKQPPPRPTLESIPSGVRAMVERAIAPLADGQQEAVLTALLNTITIITGGPGVGKSSTISALLQIYGELGLVCTVCAPTGKAAARLQELTGHEAKTIHRALEFSSETGSFARNITRPLESSLVIVDEVSMMDVNLAQAILQAVPTGASLVLLGDVDQLPSVGPGNVLADLLASKLIPTVRLTKVFRQQSESSIIDAAHLINSGKMPTFKIVPLTDTAAGDTTSSTNTDGLPDDFRLIPIEDTQTAVTTIVDLVERRIPAELGIPSSQIQVLTPKAAGSLGSRNLNELLQMRLNPPAKHKGELKKYGYTFRVGDRVMQLVNDYTKGVYNGETGCVSYVGPPRTPSASSRTRAAADLAGKAGSELEVSFDRLENVTFEAKELEKLAPAYAITIHKSQGSEFPVVVMPIHMEHRFMLQRNLLYTAVTRARRLVVVVGTRSAIELAIARASSEGSGRLTGLRYQLERAWRARSHSAQQRYPV